MDQSNRRQPVPHSSSSDALARELQDLKVELAALTRELRHVLEENRTLRQQLAAAHRPSPRAPMEMGSRAPPVDDTLTPPTQAVDPMEADRVLGRHPRDATPATPERPRSKGPLRSLSEGDRSHGL